MNRAGRRPVSSRFATPVRTSMPASLALSGHRCRLLDPTTCEREYDSAEVEFMQAVEHYKQSTGRRFPTCSEMLAIVRSLGYARVLSAADATTESALPMNCRGE